MPKDHGEIVPFCKISSQTVSHKMTKNNFYGDVFSSFDKNEKMSGSEDQSEFSFKKTIKNHSIKNKMLPSKLNIITHLSEDTSDENSPKFRETMIDLLSCQSKESTDNFNVEIKLFDQINCSTTRH